jgi:hypothetical protein
MANWQHFMLFSKLPNAALSICLGYETKNVLLIKVIELEDDARNLEGELRELLRTEVPKTKVCEEVLNKFVTVTKSAKSTITGTFINESTVL